MNENEKPAEGALPLTDPPPVEGTPEASGQEIEGTLAAIDQTIETASQGTADAAAEAEASIETLASATSSREPEVAEASAPYEEPAAEPLKALAAPESPPKENGAHKQTIGERLAEDTEFDPAATNDDRVMAALAYASQLINPIGLVLPIIILVSETSKQRPFQRYHAIQSLGVSAVIGLLEMGLTRVGLGGRRQHHRPAVPLLHRAGDDHALAAAALLRHRGLQRQALPDPWLDAVPARSAVAVR